MEVQSTLFSSHFQRIHMRDNLFHLLLCKTCPDLMGFGFLKSLGSSGSRTTAAISLHVVKLLWRVWGVYLVCWGQGGEGSGDLSAGSSSKLPVVSWAVLATLFTYRLYCSLKTSRKKWETLKTQEILHIRWMKLLRYGLYCQTDLYNQSQWLEETWIEWWWME